LWLLVTGVGVVLTTVMVYLSWTDMRFLRSQGVNSGRLYEGMHLSLWQEARRFLIKLFLFSIGVEAFFIPRRDPPPKQSVIGWVFTGALFGVVLLLNYSTIAAMRYRHKYLSPEQQLTPEQPEQKGE
jgi:hypothetical protein